ncbi:MAG: response regulator [Elusimicrobia bacterium]|nr:response regulator [Elusimicrobiota bacterium]
MDNGKGPKRLLIVDDHAGIREVFIFHMHRENFIVGEAEDGLEALTLVERCRPDLIVLDLMMPKLDGCGVLKRLQERGFGDIPVIVMTGFSEVFARDTVMTYPNVVDYLTKPFPYDGLAQRIRDFIDKGLPVAVAPQPEAPPAL